MECGFCKHLEFVKELEEDKLNNPNRNTELHSYKFKSALVHQSYYDGRPTGSSTIDFPLNFCPECGRNIKEVLDECEH